VAVGTKFAPGGFAGFGDGHTFELNDRVEPLASVFGESGTRLERELAGCAGDPVAHIAAVEDFLRDRLPEPDPRYDLVREIVSDVLVTAPETTVAELAGRHAVSPRTLQRLFRDFVGVGPKWVLKRYRMHEAAERIAAGEVDDPARLALDPGTSTSPISSATSRPRSAARPAPTPGPARPRPAASSCWRRSPSPRRPRVPPASSCSTRSGP
jgi:AraC-like DNA-binding protein